MQTALDSVECTWKRKCLSWQYSLSWNTALLLSKEDGILHSSPTLMVGNLKRLQVLITSSNLTASTAKTKNMYGQCLQILFSSCVESQCKEEVINYICPRTRIFAGSIHIHIGLMNYYYLCSLSYKINVICISSYQCEYTPHTYTTANKQTIYFGLTFKEL